MNWSLYLAEYPRSIMNDEIPLSALALLEREGLIAEEQLIALLGKDSNAIRKALIDLRMNLLLEYGKHHIRITERGKNLLERFELDNSIIEDVLNSIHVLDEHKESYRLLLHEYRNSSFKYYLNSLGTLSQWDLLCTDFSRHDKSVDRNMVYQVGKLTIMLRDLRNWWQHLGSSSVNLHGSLNKQLLKLLNTSTDELKTEHIYITLKNLEVKRSTVDRALLLLSACETGQSTNSLKYLSGKSLKDETPKLFLVFHKFQAAHEPDAWFDDWIDICDALPKRSRTRIHALNTAIDMLVKNRHLQENTTTSDSYKINWTIKSSKPKSPNTLLESLLICQSLESLSQMTGYDPEILKNLLTFVKEKCDILLKSKNTPTSSGDAADLFP